MPVPRLIPVQKISEHIPDVPRRTVDHWIQTDRLKTVKVGRHRYVTEAELLRFIGVQADGTFAKRTA